MERAVDEEGDEIFDAEYYGYDDKGTEEEEDDDHLYFIRWYVLRDKEGRDANEGSEIWLFDPDLNLVKTWKVKELPCLEHGGEKDGLKASEEGIRHGILVAVPVSLMEKAGTYYFVLHFLDNHPDKYKDHKVKPALEMNAEHNNPKIEFMRQDGDWQSQNFVSINHVHIALWDKSFDNNNMVKQFFTRYDDRRFFIRVIDKSKSALGMLHLYSFRRGANPKTSNPDDEIRNIAFHKDYSNPQQGIFITRPLIAVVDNDIIDDDFEDDSSGQNTEYDGTDDGNDDRTIWAELEGVLRAKYYRNGKLVAERQVTVCTRQHRRLVKLNIISMKSRVNNQPYWTKEEILKEIKRVEGDINSGRANKAWAQACIRFVNRNGQEITEADIQEREQPQGVDLDDKDGLDEFTEIIDAAGNLRIVETAEEKALINGVKDNDDLTIDIIFVNRLSRGSRGEAFADSITLAPEADPNHKRTVIIALNRGPFTTPHEIGHVLLNSGHFESADPNETYRNLMRAGTSAIDAVNESKRLTSNQVNTARASPLAQ